MVLSGEDVAPTHCLLTAENGVVRVRDCYSISGTRVNGHTVREMELNRDAQIQIDGYEIQLMLRAPASTSAAVLMQPADAVASREPLNEPAAESSDEPSAHPPAAAAAAEVPDAREEGVADHAAPQPAVAPETASGVDHTPDAPPVDLASDEPLMSQLHRIQLELIQARTENRILTEQLQQATTATAALPAEEAFDLEMVELLKAEVIDLQNALAAHEESAPAVASDDESVSAEEAERLVARLEELLAELQERDEQVATLTELLEATENSHDAEQVERQQVNDWLAEIEQRVGQREVEWESQNRQLQEQLNAALAARDQAESLASAENTDARLLATQEVLAGLRETAEQLQQQLTASQQEVARLNRQAQEHGQQRDREEQIRLAEEKADVARQKQELEAARHLQRTRETSEINTQAEGPERTSERDP